MSENEEKNLQTEQAVNDEQVGEQVDAQPVEDGKHKKSAKSGKSARDAKKSQSQLKKEWEDSIVASKKVKREESRRKLKRVMLILLVFSLIVTSVVYVMLLFIQENNVRITASSNNREKSISLSIDNEYWTPYLNANGPEHMWDVSYNKLYKREPLHTISEVKQMLSADKVELGEMNGEKFIRFTFMLKNTGSDNTKIDYEMTLDYDKYNLQNAVRVMWGESFKNETLDETRKTDVKVYAALSNNQRLYGTNANFWKVGDVYNGVELKEGDDKVGQRRTKEDGFVEYVAYPVGSDNASFDLLKYENDMYADSDSYAQAIEGGYFATTPYYDKDYVFKRSTTMDKGDIMYCYVCIWLEGSDFDCIDARLGGYCKIGLNFTAY